MAQRFNPLAAPGYATLARRLLGEDLELSSVAPEILLTLDLDDRPEYWAPAGGDLGYVSSALAASAGNFSAIILQNPVGSTIITIVELVNPSLAGGAGGVVRLGVGPSAAAVGTFASKGRKRDTRTGALTAVSQQTLTEVRTLQQAASLIAGVEFRYRIPGAQDGLPFIFDAVLGPGAFFVVESGAVNLALEASFTFRERRARPEELTLVG